MRVIQAHTGASCVHVPDRRVIFVDPDLSYEDAITVIQATLPDTHPDAIRHWVEAAIPSTVPLVGHIRHEYGRHRRRPLSVAVRLAGAALVAMVGAVAIMLVHPILPEQSAIAYEAFRDPVFSRVEAGAAWDCDGDHDEDDLVAECVTPNGEALHVEASVGQYALTFVFTYNDLTEGGKPQRNTLKAFEDVNHKEAFVAQAQATRRMFPNLVAGPSWVLYGTDKNCVHAWASRIGEAVPVPEAFKESVKNKMGASPNQ